MEPRPPERRFREAGEEVARNIASALAAQVLTVIATAAVTVFLVRSLTPASYGLLALAISIGALLEMPSDFGISPSTARLITSGRSDRAGAAAVVAEALRLKLVSAIAVAVVLALAAGPVAEAYGQPALAGPLRLVGVALAGQSFMLLHANVLAARGSTSLYVRIVAGKGIVELTATVALVLLGAGIIGAAAGRAAGFLFGGLVGVAVLVRLLGDGALRGDLGRRTIPRRREILRYGRALLVIDGAMTLFAHLDVLLIGAILGTAAVALFEAPLRLTVPLFYLAQAVATGLAPRLAGGGSDEARAFAGAVRWLLIVQAAIAAVVFAWAEPAVTLVLGERYAESADVLRGLTPFILLSGLAPLLTMTANYLGLAGRRVPLAIAAVALNLAIDVALIPEIGVVAGAIGTSAAFALYVPGHLWICRRAVGLPLAPVLITLARSLAAAAVMAGVLLATAASAPGVAAWLGGGLLGLVAYLAVLAATRELSHRDLLTARSAWQRVRSAAS